MKMSCSGCRVLRRGCSDNCSIRPCLQWIKSAQSQANATVFLAKFYGRAGLINLIDAGPEHLRPAIFRSLVYEACGRMVNPIHGSTGLLWSGNWQFCQAAVEAVLKGAPIMQAPFETAATGPVPLLHKASSYDIRHVAKEDGGVTAEATHDLDLVNKATQTRVKRKGNQCYDPAEGAGVEIARAKRRCCAMDVHSSPSRVWSGSQASEPSSTDSEAVPCDGNSRRSETMLSVETAKASMVTRSHGEAEAGNTDCRDANDSEVELELTLGFEPFHFHHRRSNSSSGSSHNRAHSPTWSSSSSAAAEAPEKCVRKRAMRVGGDVIAVDHLAA